MLFMLIKPITIFLGVSITAAILFGGLAFSQSAFAGDKEDKITICHVSQDTGESKTISVGKPAAEHHLSKHEGDRLGQCGSIQCTECEEQAGKIFFDCFDAGGTGTECRVLMEPFLTECALTCQGSDEEKESACNVASSVQFSVCLDTDAETDFCADKTRDFLSECIGS